MFLKQEVSNKFGDLILEDIVNDNIEVGEFVMCCKQEKSLGDFGASGLTYPCYDFYEGKAYAVIEKYAKGCAIFDSEDGRLGVSLGNFKKIKDSKRTIDVDAVSALFKKSQFKEIHRSEKLMMFQLIKDGKYYFIMVNPVQWIYKCSTDYKFLYSDFIVPVGKRDMEKIMSSSKSFYIY